VNIEQKGSKVDKKPTNKDTKDRKDIKKSKDKK